MFATLYMFIPYNDVWSWEQVRTFSNVSGQLLADLTRGLTHVATLGYDDMTIDTYMLGITYKVVVTY